LPKFNRRRAATRPRVTFVARYDKGREPATSPRPSSRPDPLEDHVLVIAPRVFHNRFSTAPFGVFHGYEQGTCIGYRHETYCPGIPDAGSKITTGSR
jgi:hypothetical protein